MMMSASRGLDLSARVPRMKRLAVIHIRENHSTCVDGERAIRGRNLQVFLFFSSELRIAVGCEEGVIVHELIGRAVLHSNRFGREDSESGVADDDGMIRVRECVQRRKRADRKKSRRCRSNEPKRTKHENPPTGLKPD